MPNTSSVYVCFLFHVYLCGCKLSIPGHGGCNLTGGLTLVNPLLGVLRMMMWAVDPPRWFHFLRASSRSQIEKLWWYYKVKGWLTFNMMTIPSWHFHFLKRLAAVTTKTFAYFCSNNFFFVFFFFGTETEDTVHTAEMHKHALPFWSQSHSLLLKILINMALLSLHMHTITPFLPYKHASLLPFIFGLFHFVLQMSSEVRPCSQPVGVADVFNGIGFVSWWWDKHGEEIKTPGFLPQSPAFILLPLAVVMQGHPSRV